MKINVNVASIENLSTKKIRFFMIKRYGRRKFFFKEHVCNAYLGQTGFRTLIYCFV